MSNTAQFHIVYDGPALDNNEINVRDLAPSLLAFADAIEEANRVLNGNRAKIVVNVKASFKTGCFGVDLNTVQSIADSVLSLFKNDDIVAATALLGFLGITVTDTIRVTTKGLIGLIKWIRGRKITSIEMTNDGTAKISIDEDDITVEHEIIELLKSYKLRKAIEKAYVEPLEKGGIDSVSTIDDSEYLTDKSRISIVNRDEAEYYKTPEAEDEYIETVEYETNLQLVSVVFQEKNKWRFTEGDSAFYADVNDENFIKAVQNNQESFSKDDILTVRMKKQQFIKEGQLKSEYEIKKVLNHRSAQQQIKLPFK